MLIFEVFILLLAGLGAGVVTGLLGASAVTIAAPLMIFFLNYDAFTAIGISLAIDIFASGVTAFVFHKNKNVHFKPSFLIIFFAIIGAFIGSYFSSYFPTSLLSKFVGFFVMLTGINFMKDTLKSRIEHLKAKYDFDSNHRKLIIMALSGIIVGLIAGVFGAGGGVTLLLILTLLLGYRIHVAIGTSVFIMMFIALSGTIGHIMYGSFLWYPFFVASMGGIVGAYYSAHKTNTLSEKSLNKIMGFIFFVLGLFLLLEEFFYLIY